ncbi:RNA polymerase factor sigma-54 [Tuwongella immobilis]|uniref:RNA polymerase sigma-54 factor n=1 Tax=Tuwongella immobilis TaxID=692036 RepID=A0A6C2YH52_9BACT|nr:RNA polymerase factor sigma-54 [Tuwongella immobilis]VIP00850.1 rna sigma 54 : RNA polymerase sigma-54 factor OS=Singulisphaera acidiphila (strain ATCC BAA-1392 / DSM 18658 / VKM B-2454 / MOB10) GN=Sinac_1313 PE=4 SV=1: Sigma54_AID: Sigma54_CBD: Sigma54_DBD [Tuwongella immobilis]VTR97118.1 rna sigma 54 : RNA polymerase sigma-54 factor OS=Singulisphaera acidiphila (strain ATCC BAA-1392 / DSM 18658 / VKM B-2454 / MOB10) GN=Sinac_1313 PE=4 SV=1: Sigma54_AID: Sigma54_CBD: Sigma54_DBD [Tuwongella i
MHQNLSLGQRQTQNLSLIIAPRMIQSMEILQLPALALQERIEQELQENPVLELRDPADDFEASDDSLRVEKEPDPDGPLVHDADNELDFTRLDAINQDWDQHFNEDQRPSRSALDEEGDRKHDAMQNMPSRPQSLQDYLTEQLAFLELSPEQFDRVTYLISHLNDSGYLDESLPALLKAYDRPSTLDELEDALAELQKLDPLGVGARDTKECLLLQITPEMPHRDILRRLILNHLEDIQHNRLPIIQRRTGFDLNAIREAIEILKRFNLRPGSQFHSEQTHFIIPDIIVERNDKDEYEIRLADDWTPTLNINTRYSRLARERGADPKTKDYLKRKILAAQWLIEAIEQRRNTLLKVTKAIIAHQRAFLDQGPEAIEPLKMQQIADQVGVHVTTVSRAVDDKWVQTPRGVFPLKRFFGGGVQSASGEEIAWEKIKLKLLELIGNEDKSNPLSDEDLVTKFNEAGYPIARRTVTKYRKMLKIPSSRQRKDWGS